MKIDIVKLQMLQKIAEHQQHPTKASPPTRARPLRLSKRGCRRRRRRRRCSRSSSRPPPWRRWSARRCRRRWCHSRWSRLPWAWVPCCHVHAGGCKKKAASNKAASNVAASVANENKNQEKEKQGEVKSFKAERQATQRPRIDLNKRFSPRPNTITAWKLILYRSKITKN